jgi:hypothetical protein
MHDAFSVQADDLRVPLGMDPAAPTLLPSFFISTLHI